MPSSSSSILLPGMWVLRLELWQPFWIRRYLWEWKSQTRKVGLQTEEVWGTNHLMESHDILELSASRLVLNEK